MKTLMRLKREVKNPRGDRRYKYDPMCLPVFEKGSLWTRDKYRCEIPGIEQTYNQYQFEGRSHSMPVHMLSDIGLTEDDFEVVEAKTWAQINMVMHGYDCAPEVINILIEEEKLTPADVLLAYQGYLDRDDD